MTQKLGSSVLVILVPIFLLALLGAATGSFGIGYPEMAILLLVWIAGLVWVWRPARSRG